VTPAAEAIWPVLVLVGIGTFLLRLSFVGLAGRLSLPDPVARALRFVPAAVLSAIIVPAVFRTETGSLDLLLVAPRVLAALVAIAVAWRTRNILATLAAGMLVLWLTALAL